VLSPGIPLTHPAPHWSVQRAREAGVPITGDVDLFFQERAARCPQAPVLAITGTNGKSTTTALAAHAHAGDGR
jgi:UDP-N-acetylmuramoylalanine--D-glutamate ligase